MTRFTLPSLLCHTIPSATAVTLLTIKAIKFQIKYLSEATRKIQLLWVICSKIAKIGILPHFVAQGIQDCDEIETAALPNADVAVGS